MALVPERSKSVAFGEGRGIVVECRCQGLRDTKIDAVGSDFLPPHPVAKIDGSGLYLMIHKSSFSAHLFSCCV
jgi:hypothetical protein